jgi:hypothetical protein
MKAATVERFELQEERKTPFRAPAQHITPIEGDSPLDTRAI